MPIVTAEIIVQPNLLKTKLPVLLPVLLVCGWFGSELAGQTSVQGRYPLFDSVTAPRSMAPQSSGPQSSGIQLNGSQLSGPQWVAPETVAPPVPIESLPAMPTTASRQALQTMSVAAQPVEFPSAIVQPAMVQPAINQPAIRSFDFSSDFAAAYENLGTTESKTGPFLNASVAQSLPVAQQPIVAAPELPNEITEHNPDSQNGPSISDSMSDQDRQLSANEPTPTREASSAMNNQNDNLFQPDPNFQPAATPELSTTSRPERTTGLVSNEPIWWKPVVVKPLNAESSLVTDVETVNTNSLVFAALKNSPRIQAISQNPLIRELQVIEADSEFDPVSFVQSSFADRNDPVGNTLITGGAPFLQDNIWNGQFGLRKKTRTGASIEASELLGFKNSNSTFFVPQDQGTATLALNVTQPLLRGRGRYYNQSQILIAQATGGAAWDTFSNELQDELQAVTQSYWRLYYDRCLYLQKQRNVERGLLILEMLEGRSDLDSLPSQIARARSAVMTRRTELANALRDVRNSETEIRRRIADRDWMTAQTIELLPTETPLHDSIDIPLDKVVMTAIEQRREIKEVMQRAKIAGVQTDISSNELLPELSLLLGTYVSGLKGGSAIGQAIVQQFDVTPGYNVGIQFEMPYQNRAARSRLAQRKLQMAKIKAEVDETVQTVIAESQVALRRVNSALQTLAASEQAIVAARADLSQQQSRWEAFGLVEGDLADGQNPTLMLNQLLDSQERLTATELVYAQAELELKIAEVALQRAMGTLLMHENIDYGMIRNGDDPEMLLDAGGQRSE